MEDQYANEAHMADRRGDSRLAADKYLQAVQAATNKLSDTRIHGFMVYIFRFLVSPDDQDDDDDNFAPRPLPAENKDIVTLNSFLDDPDEPTYFRAAAAMALAEIHHFDDTGRRDAELAAIYARRCIQECFKASNEERNHAAAEAAGNHGDALDNMRDKMTERLDLLEYPATAGAYLASLPFTDIVTSNGSYDKRALTKVFGDGVSLDHLARRLTVGGKTCDSCGKERDPMDLCSLLFCGRCQMAYYCSAECQRQQWNEGGHKKACRKLGEFREGDAIRLDGLSATPHYNNSVALALRQVDNRGGEQPRWAIRTYAPDNGSIQMFCIKESNMRRIRPADIR